MLSFDMIEFHLKDVNDPCLLRVFCIAVPTYKSFLNSDLEQFLNLWENDIGFRLTGETDLHNHINMI